MTPLLAAVAHGCEAGRHQEVLDKVVERRIYRKDMSFINKILGAHGAALSVLSSFFDPPWKEPVGGIKEYDKASVLGNVGYCLRALGRLEEAVQPMQDALEAYVALKTWEDASSSASNLSELYLAMGDLVQALNLAKESVEIADYGRNVFNRLAKRATLANALYYANRISDSVITFRKSEEMFKKYDGKSSFLYSTMGFMYCNLLLSQRKYEVVLNRARQTMKIAKRSNIPLDIALDNLSLGRAYMQKTQQNGSRDFVMATEHLNEAVEGLRQAGTQHHLPRGLLARAELYRVSGEFTKAWHDLDETMVIAERGSMGLHQVDCHLEYTRLHLAIGEKGKGRERLDIAKKMIEKMVYHLRDNDVTEIEGQL
jgi:tetratricopeptide (TPR) repeat protein